MKRRNLFPIMPGALTGAILWLTGCASTPPSPNVHQIFTLPLSAHQELMIQHARGGSVEGVQMFCAYGSYDGMSLRIERVEFPSEDAGITCPSGVAALGLLHVGSGCGLNQDERATFDAWPEAVALVACRSLDGGTYSDFGHLWYVVYQKNARGDIFVLTRVSSVRLFPGRIAIFGE